MLELVAPEVEREIAEAIDDEHDGPDPVVPDLRLRDVHSHELDGRLFPYSQHDIGFDNFAPHLVGNSDYRGFGRYWSPNGPRDATRCRRDRGTWPRRARR